MAMKKKCSEICANPERTTWIEYALDSGKRPRPFSLERAMHKDSRFLARFEFSRRHRSAGRVYVEGC
jgi:hypothetical protein